MKISKKDTKYMNRDYTISYIDGFNRHELYARPPPLIHTLIPLPLPVHLPLPLMSENQFVDKHPGHPLLPTQTHLISNADHSLHNHHLIHDGTGEPIFAMGSNHMVESGHPLPLMVPNAVPLDMSMQLAAESEVFPVQVLPVFMKDDSFESIANGGGNARITLIR
ncbi:unnamed protein product [Medioppia subpectinata]|uniref:Uncharacterized protein n=1 Tax=Medioppia subpectinata TaxID=1979941 RepID=A0A7R9KV77_9ACAR|nr:unnamed protein product [Medioppia subpectinata]CAG2110083.1 unnamed protein product [Medioppia subpectinata]